MIKKISLGILIVAISGIALNQWIQKEKQQVAPSITYSKKQEHKQQNIQGAIEHRRQMLQNQDGEIPLDYIQKVKQQVKTRLSNSTYKSAAALGLQWTELGPDNVGGRTRAFLIDKDNPNLMFMGGVSGGLWKSTTGGSSWVNVNDSLSSLQVSCITQASNGDIYFGTGETFTSTVGGNNPSGGSAFPGEGIYKSTDGGKSFQLLEATVPTSSQSTNVDWSFINDVAAHPDSPLVIYACAIQGLMKTVDGGINWTEYSSSDVPANPLDIKISTNGEVILVGFTGGSRLSINGGESFDNPNTEGYPEGDIGRVECAIAPQDENYLYLYIAHAGRVVDERVVFPLRGLYQSKDKGESWIELADGGAPEVFNPPGDQGNYDLCIAVSPTNKEFIYIGGQVSSYSWSPNEGFVQKSIGGGGSQPGEPLPSFPLYVHPDHHNIHFKKGDGNTMYMVTDGGLFKTSNITDAAPTWTALNRNYAVTQFYSMAASITGEIIGGTQDNGTQYVDYTGFTVRRAIQANGGDGGYCAISKLNTNFVIAESQFGRLTRSSDKAQNFEPSGIFDEHIDCNVLVDGGCEADGIPDPTGPFITVFELYEDLVDSTSNLYLGTVADLWVTADPFNFQQTPTWFNITEEINLGLSASNRFTFVSAIEYSADGDIVYFATTEGRLFRATGLSDAIFDYNDPRTWDTVSVDSTGMVIAFDSMWHADNAGIIVESINFPGSGYISDVAFDKTNNNRIIVTRVGYDNNPHVYLSTNATAATPSFNSIQGNVNTGLPGMPVYAAVIDIANSNRIILGTELGIWTTDNPNGSLTQWTQEINGMANVPTYRVIQEPIIQKANDVDLSDNCYVIYAATHGRGMFKTNSLTSTFCQETVTVGIEPVVKNMQKLSIYPNPIFTGETGNMNYNLANASEVEITIFSIDGKIVRRENKGKKASGVHNDIINTANLTSGNYIVAVKADGQLFTGKILIAK